MPIVRLTHTFEADTVEQLADLADWWADGTGKPAAKSAVIRRAIADAHRFESIRNSDQPHRPAAKPRKGRTQKPSS